MQVDVRVRGTTWNLAAVAVVSAVNFAAANFVTAADASRPNILFAFADDWGRVASADARIDGPGTINDVVSTPNIDRVTPP
jgi:hypothetical protein